MSHTRLYLIALLVLILPALTMMTKKPIYPSQDALYHIERIKEFDRALNEGQIPPRLAPTVAGSIGYPLFVVNYQTPYFISEIFLKVTNDAETAFKSTLILSYILSAVFSFILFRQFAQNIESLSGALVFSYLPYRFANIYTRGSLGESTALMFVPLLLLSINLLNKNKRHALPLLALSVFGLITSHTVVFLIFLPFLATYPFILKGTNISTLAKIILGTLMGIFASSYQLIPSVFEKKYLKFDENLLSLYRDHFLNIKQLLRIPSPGINTGTTLQLGITASLLIVIAIVKLFLSLKNKALTLFSFFLVFAIFLTNSASIWLWQNLSPLKFILYPWRFLSLAAFCAAFCSVLILKDLKYKAFFACVIVLLTIYSSRHYFLKSTQFESNIPTSNLTTQNEFDPIWTTASTFINRPIISAKGIARLTITSQRPYDLTFNIDTEKDNEILIRKLYFPNWNVLVNNTPISSYQKDGLVALNLTKGSHKVTARYESDTLTQTANIATIISLLFIGLLFFLPA